VAPNDIVITVGNLVSFNNAGLCMHRYGELVHVKRNAGVYIPVFDFTPPPGEGKKYDRKGIWGKNMKKVKRKEEEKKKKEKKREKKMEINLINNTFFPLPSSGSPI
jgi:hypothetical protein